MVAALIAAWAVLRGKGKNGQSDPDDAQGNINEGFRLFMRESRERILKLESDNRGLKNYINLLVGIMHTHGIDVPPANVIQGGFIILPPDVPKA